MTTPLGLITIDVGNSRTRLGRFEGREIAEIHAFPNDDLAAIAPSIAEAWQATETADSRAIILASVHDAAAERLAGSIDDQLGVSVYRVGADLPVPVAVDLDPETITGVDRLLNASAAFALVNQACVVVDAGSAITVDFVDGEGTFHGGAIAPGAQMQLAALHQHTEALPELTFRPPDPGAFGKSTAEAMLLGVFHGIRGMVQRLTERYAEAYGAYPLLIATGGDATALFEGEELVDRIVPELTLRGIAIAAQQALASAEDA